MYRAFSRPRAARGLSPFQPSLGRGDGQKRGSGGWATGPCLATEESDRGPVQARSEGAGQRS
eukprot:5500189-Alexandrium_andersonii.AAC.1